MQILHVSTLSNHSDALRWSDLAHWLNRNGDDGINRITVDLVDEHTTLRRHMASKHKVSILFHLNASQFNFYMQGLYRRWCKSANFLSMIPEDAKARHAEAITKMEQTQVDDHFHRVGPEDKPMPYSDGAFKDAAIRWLIETDQVPISTLDPTNLPYQYIIACGRI